MSKITKHDSGKEWKSHNHVNSWIDLRIARNTVSIHDSLKCFREFVGPNIGWWNSISLELVENSRGGSGAMVDSLKSGLN